MKSIGWSVGSFQNNLARLEFVVSIEKVFVFSWSWRTKKENFLDRGPRFSRRNLFVLFQSSAGVGISLSRYFSVEVGTKTDLLCRKTFDVSSTVILRIISSQFVDNDWVKKIERFSFLFAEKFFLSCEGTRYSEEKRIESMKIAKEKSLAELKHHILPRTKGFSLLIKEIHGHGELFRSSIRFWKRDFIQVDAIYDMTIAFRSTERPRLKDVLLGEKFSAQAFIRRIPIENVPFDDEQKSAAFIHKLFQEKVRFSSASNPWKISAEKFLFFFSLSRTKRSNTSCRTKRSKALEILERRIYFVANTTFWSFWFVRFSSVYRRSSISFDFWCSARCFPNWFFYSFPSQVRCSFRRFFCADRIQPNERKKFVFVVRFQGSSAFSSWSKRRDPNRAKCIELQLNWFQWVTGICVLFFRWKFLSLAILSRLYCKQCSSNPSKKTWAKQFSNIRKQINVFCFKKKPDNLTLN